MQEQNEATITANIAQRFSLLQTECRRIGRDGDVDSGKFKYDYVTFPKLRDMVGELFDKHGFFFSQPLRTTNEGKNILQTIICDAETGREFLHSEMTLYPRNDNNSQDWGASISYMRRYQLMSVLGIASDENDEDYLDETEIKARIKSCESIKELNNLYHGIRQNQRDSLKKEFQVKKETFKKEQEQINEQILKSAKIK